MDVASLDKLEKAVKLLASIAMDRDLEVIHTPLDTSHMINGEEYKSHLYFKLEKIED